MSSTKMIEKVASMVKDGVLTMDEAETFVRTMANGQVRTAVEAEAPARRRPAKGRTTTDRKAAAEVKAAPKVQRFTEASPSRLKGVALSRWAKGHVVSYASKAGVGAQYVVGAKHRDGTVDLHHPSGTVFRTAGTTLVISHGRVA